MLPEHVRRLQLNKFIFVITGGFHRLRELAVGLDRALVAGGSTGGRLGEIWSPSELEQFAGSGRPGDAATALSAHDPADDDTLAGTVWTSLAAAVMAEWDQALRGFSQFLVHHLKIEDEMYAYATGGRPMEEFESFVGGPVGLDFDFEIPEWQVMAEHVQICDALKQHHGRLQRGETIEHETDPENHVRRLTTVGNEPVCDRRYAESIIEDALNFFVVLDQTLREQFRHI